MNPVLRRYLRGIANVIAGAPIPRRRCLFFCDFVVKIYCFFVTFVYLSDLHPGKLCPHGFRFDFDVTIACPYIRFMPKRDVETFVQLSVCFISSFFELFHSFYLFSRGIKAISEDFLLRIRDPESLNKGNGCRKSPSVRNENNNKD